MMNSNEYLRRGLETKQQIQFYKRQVRFFPYTRKKVQCKINELQDYLEILALDYHRQRQRSSN